MSPEKLKIGDVEILSLSDCMFTPNVYELFPDQPKEAWDAYRDQVDEDGRVKTPANLASFLITSRDHLVLVDTGIGPDPSDPFPKGTLLDKLRSAGVKPEDVDIVFATHMHFDHLGWHVTMRDGVPTSTFPNARYVLPEVDWNALFDPDEPMRRHPDDYSKGAVETYSRSRPIADRLKQIGNVELVKGDHSLVDEITTVETPGHTPGHMSLLVSSAGERLFVLGDVVHVPVQLDVPERIMFADVHPDLGRRTRTETIEWLEREGLMVAAVHFPAPGFGRVVRGQARRYWQAL